MAYFVVVHHRRDESQPWPNGWLDDDRLDAISTKSEIAMRCALAKQQGERIFVHRCGWTGGPPKVCCSVAVESAGHKEETGWVQFYDARILNVPPSHQPGRGENHYDAPAPTSESP